MFAIEIGQVFVENLREQNTTEGILFTVPLQSRVGFVGGLQNRYAILHAAKLTYVYAFG